MTIDEIKSLQTVQSLKIRHDAVRPDSPAIATMAGYHPSTPWPKNLKDFDLEADILVERSFGFGMPRLSSAAYADQAFGLVTETQPGAVADEESQLTDEVEEGRGNPFVTFPLAEERSNRAGRPTEAKVETAKKAPVTESREEGIGKSLPVRSKKQYRHDG